MSGGAEFRKLVDRLELLERKLAAVEDELQPTSEQIATLKRIDALLKTEAPR